MIKLTDLEYNADTGDITRGNKIISTKGDGICYKQVFANGREYYAHRIAWYLYYGEWPKNQIDHVNGIKDDNRINNLRDVTAKENSRNQKVHRNGRLIGAHKKGKKWTATIKVDGKAYYLGTFDTQQDAHVEWVKKSIELSNKCKQKA